MSLRDLSFPGCSPSYISRLENGTRLPSLQLINALAAKLGVSPEWLAAEKHQMGTSPEQEIYLLNTFGRASLENLRLVLGEGIPENDPVRMIQILKIFRTVSPEKISAKARELYALENPEQQPQPEPE